MTENQNHPGERIAKIIARAGLCSRRDAEAWVSAGRVSVNGKVLESPAFNVQPDDKVLVDGEPLAQRERTRLFFFHKPRGTVTTAYDPEGRTTIFDALPRGLPRVVTVGRLDINTEGLLLLTNDGGLARALELPSTGWLRRYKVRAHGRTDQAKLDELGKGLTIDGVNYRGIEARLDREQGSNVWMTIGLREGKNREVRKVLEHIGLEVNRLIRLSFGPFQLGELEEGAVEEVKTRILQDQLGEKIAQLANADFDAPLFEDAPGGGRREIRETQLPRGAGAGYSQRQDGSKFVSRGNGSRVNRSTQDAEDDAPRESPKPGKRRHISALRDDAKARAKNDNERRRIERGQTADRRGRSVAIERVVATTRKQKPEADDAPPIRRSRRNARNFAALNNAADVGPADMLPRGEQPRRKPRPAANNNETPNFNRGPSARGGKRDVKFKQPDRGFERPRTRRPDFQDTIVPDRIPWGAPQDDEQPRAEQYRPERQNRQERQDKPRDQHTRDQYKSDQRTARGDKPINRGPRDQRSWNRGEQADRPRDEKSRGEFSRGRNPRGNSGYADSPRGSRPHADRPHADRPHADRHRADRPYSDRPRADRSSADRSFGDKPGGSKFRTGPRDFDRARESKPEFRKRGDRPFGSSSSRDNQSSQGPGDSRRGPGGGRDHRQETRSQDTRSRGYGDKDAGYKGPGNKGPNSRGPNNRGPNNRGPGGKGPGSRGAGGRGSGGGGRPAGKGRR